MKTLLSICLFCLPALLVAQTVDSTDIRQVDSLNMVTKKYIEQFKFKKALESCETAEKLALEKLGRESGEYGYACALHGRISLQQGKIAQAQKWHKEALDIRLKVHGAESWEYAASLDELARDYTQSGKFKLAEPLFLEAYEIRKKNFGDKKLYYSLMNLGTFYMISENHEKAKPYLVEALKTVDKEKEPVVYAKILNNLASLYKDLEEYENALPLYEESLEIFEKNYGKDHPHTSTVLTNLAGLYMYTGNLKEAEILNIRSNAIMAEGLGKAHPDYATGLANLAYLYRITGSFDKAEALFLEAREISEKALGKKNQQYTYMLRCLGNTYSVNGNPDKAEAYFIESLTIEESLFGKEHHYYAEGLKGLGELYYFTRNYEKAEATILECKEIEGKVLGKTHSHYAESLYLLADIYSRTGRQAQAERYFNEGKAIVEAAVGKQHMLYGKTLYSLSQFYELQKRYTEAEAALDTVFEIGYALLNRSVSFLSEQELTNHYTHFQLNGNTLLSFLSGRRSAGAETGKLSELAFNHALLQKGFLLMAARSMNSQANSTPEGLELNNNLKGLRRRLAAQLALPMSERKGVDELEEKVNTVEKELARTVAGYADASRQVNWHEVQATLKKGEAAIEFIRYKINFPAEVDTLLYVALVLQPGAQQPEFVPLFEETQLDRLLRNSSGQKTDYANQLYDNKKLYELLWQPLENTLAGAQTVYFAPSGLLHRLNIGAIPDNENHRLAERFRLIQLNSTRQLVIPQQLNSPSNSAELYGGIQFDMDSVSYSVANPLLMKNTALATRGMLDFSTSDTTLRGGHWNFLHWTEVEVNSLQNILEEAGAKTRVLSGYAASEEAFKALGNDSSPSPRILHLATHGFFFPDPAYPGTSMTGGLTNSAPLIGGVSQEGATTFIASEHPMIRSGLILAGGNFAWENGKALRSDMEDGILTAYEISQMNLSNTELVVLSACETGLGDIQGNEGVYGLQRAFKIAGVKYLIMSLWQVPDFQTQELMTAFYLHWLKDSKPLPEAFRLAQQEMQAKYKDPFLWAGFVLIE